MATAYSTGVLVNPEDKNITVCSHEYKQRSLGSEFYTASAEHVLDEGSTSSPNTSTEVSRPNITFSGIEESGYQTSRISKEEGSDVIESHKWSDGVCNSSVNDNIMLQRRTPVSEGSISAAYSTACVTKYLEDAVSSRMPAGLPNVESSRVPIATPTHVQVDVSNFTPTIAERSSAMAEPEAGVQFGQGNVANGILTLLL